MINPREQFKYSKSKSERWARIHRHLETVESETNSPMLLSDVSNIFAAIAKAGSLSPARFEIELNLPLHLIQPNDSLRLSPSEISRRLSQSCESLSLPGRGVSTTPNRIYGPVREMPHERLYSGDLDMTFRIGKDMLERDVFEKWMDQIVDKNSNDFKYYNEYTTEMNIAQLDHTDKQVYKIKLFDIYPKTINPIDYNASTVDDYVRQSISFHFRKYEVVPVHEIATLDNTPNYIKRPNPPNFVEFPPPNSGIPPLLERDSEVVGNLPPYLLRP